MKFVNEVPFAAIRFILDSAKLNCALSQEGLSGGNGYWRDAEKQCERGLLAKDLFIHCDSYQRGIRCAYGAALRLAMSNSGLGNQDYRNNACGGGSRTLRADDERWRVR